LSPCGLVGTKENLFATVNTQHQGSTSLHRGGRVTKLVNQTFGSPDLCWDSQTLGDPVCHWNRQQLGAMACQDACADHLA
ncbi:hypothetical protein SK128_027027, partial [Halocaridina rubra]